MGYFDGLTSGNFKTAQDGRKLFFPWGYMGRGYVLVSEYDAERMRRQLKIYYLVMLVAIVGLSGGHAFIVSAAAAGLGIAFYAIWARRQDAGLQPAGETMSFRKSSASQARAVGGFCKFALCCLSPQASLCTSPTRPIGRWRCSRSSSLAAARSR